MKAINFKVLKIEQAEKKDCVKVNLKFNDSEKEYTYVRKTFNREVLIDGCKIFYTKEFKVLKIERIYDTKGFKKTSTANQVGVKNILEVQSKLKEIISTPKPKKIIEKVIESKDVHHNRYDEIKMCLECDIPIYLAGPAGSGKNYTVEQIAKELNWNFYFSNSVQQEYKLTGFIDAGGNFHDTEFYKACTDNKDCIFFLDEMDASIPEVLVLLNAAIANGYFEFPNGRINFNHVHFVSAGNTVGTGADDMYTGRMVLDQATLDRFAIIEFDYCKNIEKSITNNNVDLIKFIHQLRKEAEQKGIRATFSYRCMTMVTKLEKKGMPIEYAIKISILKGLDVDTINTLNPQGQTKYHQALNQIKNIA